MTEIRWLKNVRILSMDSVRNDLLGTIENGLIGWSKGKIHFVGTLDNAPASFNGENCEDGKNQWVTPGLIDSHTHLIWGGQRSTEFEALLNGKSYAEIAQKGGGIMGTVKATRELSEDELFQRALPRLNRLISEGVTTVEIKSGYGLNEASELKMLQVMERLEQHTHIDIQKTCLAAHCVPAEYAGNDQAYVDWICTSLLPLVAENSLADAVDVFCESIAFSASQSRQVLTTAVGLGLKIKGHVEQLTQSGGADVLAELGAISADHVEFVDDSQAKKLGAAGVAAVLLPGAFYFLGETKKPPIAAFRKFNVDMAVATDMNPGSSPLGSLLIAANMACVLWQLTPAEAWLAITSHAAKALGLSDQKGKIMIGMDADFLLWNVETPVQLIHEMAVHQPVKIWVNGDEIQPITAGKH